MEQKREAHVLLLPYPNQGHINPMFQFAKRLSFHGIKTSLAITRYISSSTQPKPGPVSIVTISDGFDQFGFASASTIKDYLARLEIVGSATLTELIESFRSANQPVHALVYDAMLTWAYDVGSKLGLKTASFFTMACAVDLIFEEARSGRIKYPVTEPVLIKPGLPRLEPKDMPSFLSDPVCGPYPAYLELLLNQYKNLEKADLVLINSFYELESQEFDVMKSMYRIKSIGPTVPSAYMDNRIPTDTEYAINLHAPDSQSYISFLSSKPPSSVIYISFGSMASLTSTQTHHIVSALKNLTTSYNFLWVVRSSELLKLPSDFIPSMDGLGMVVTWCNQLEVLRHESVGCFVTHCGWNSVMEAIGIGVAMVGMPQWTDQRTNAKYVADVWKVGVRANTDEDGDVMMEEFEKAVEEVMVGRRDEILENVVKWKELAKGAVSEGGSSDVGFLEFIDELCE